MSTTGGPAPVSRRWTRPPGRTSTVRLRTEAPASTRSYHCRTSTEWACCVRARRCLLGTVSSAARCLRASTSSCLFIVSSSMSTPAPGSLELGRLRKRAWCSTCRAAIRRGLAALDAGGVIGPVRPNGGCRDPGHCRVPDEYRLGPFLFSFVTWVRVVSVCLHAATSSPAEARVRLSRRSWCPPCERCERMCFATLLPSLPAPMMSMEAKEWRKGSPTK